MLDGGPLVEGRRRCLVHRSEARGAIEDFRSTPYLIKFVFKNLQLLNKNYLKILKG